MKNSLLLGAFFLWAAMALAGCASEAEKELAYAFKLAGANRPELEKVLAHYPDDSLKREAAAFLIRNMIYHTTSSPQGMQKDITCLKASFLTQTIDLAFEAWDKPWSRKISFDDFCRYILPYRAVNEPPCRLRREIMDEFMPLLERLQPRTPLEAGTAVQAILKERLRFEEGESTYYPSVEEVYGSGKGKCDGLAITAAFVFRAVGIPTTIEYTVWSKRDGEHYWCALLNDDRKFYSFAPENEPPGKLAPMLTRKWVTPAKIYRYEYAPVVSCSAEIRDAYRTFLKSPLLRDVTAEYNSPVTCIRIRSAKKRKRKEGLVYLCAFNQADWRPLAMGKRENDVCTVCNVVGDDLFILAEASEDNSGRLDYITAPFYLGRQGQIHFFASHSRPSEPVYLSRREKKYADLIETLSLWDDAIQRFRPLRLPLDSTDALWVLKDAPSNALFKARIRQVSLSGEIRPLFFEGDSVRIY